VPVNQLPNDSTVTTFTAIGRSNSQNSNSNISGDNTTITQQLSFGGSTSGYIFKIENLPTGSSGLPTGTVYRNSNYLMIV
jgi:hypothetical protein